MFIRQSVPHGLLRWTNVQKPLRLVFGRERANLDRLGGLAFIRAFDEPRGDRRLVARRAGSCHVQIVPDQGDPNVRTSATRSTLGPFRRTTVVANRPSSQSLVSLQS